jgi:hypothetical protein
VRVFIENCLKATEEAIAERASPVRLRPDNGTDESDRLGMVQQGPEWPGSRGCSVPNVGIPQRRIPARLARKGSQDGNSRTCNREFGDHLGQVVGLLSERCVPVSESCGEFDVVSPRGVSGVSVWVAIPLGPNLRKPVAVEPFSGTVAVALKVKQNRRSPVPAFVG